MMDKFTVIRSLVGAGGRPLGRPVPDRLPRHDQQGPGRSAQPRGRRLASSKGPVHPDMPPFVGLSPRTGELRWGNPGDPGYLGLAHAPFTPFRTEAREPARTASRAAGDAGLSLDDKVITPERLAGRRSLLGQLDDLRRTFDHDEAMQGMDSFTQRAFEVLVVAPGLRGARPDQGRPAAPRPLRHRRHAQRGRRSAVLHGPLPDGPPPGRGRRAGGHDLVRPLGYPRPELPVVPHPHSQARHGPLDAGRRPAPPRARQGRLGRRLGRVRPHAQDQQGRRPRPLAAREFRPAGRRRHAHRPGHRLDRQRRRATPRIARSHSRTSSPRSTTTSASTPALAVADRSGRPMYLLDEHEPIRELV